MSDVEAAYKRERAAAVETLEALKALDPSMQFVIPSGFSPKLTPALMLGPTASDLVGYATSRVAQIDAALEGLRVK